MLKGSALRKRPCGGLRYLALKKSGIGLGKSLVMGHEEDLSRFF